MKTDYMLKDNVKQTIQTEKNSNILDIEVKNYGECGFCKDDKETLSVSWNIYSQWLFLMNKMGNKEWGGILFIKNKEIIDFKIPEQEVTSVQCEFKEELGGQGIIHSHHTMGAFHSNQDDEHARNLYDYSIVMSNQEIIATKRKKLPCGGLGYAKVDVIITNFPDINLNKIKEKTYTSVYQENPYLINNDITEECYKCLKVKKNVSPYELNGVLIYLCSDCAKKQEGDKEKLFLCDNCMQHFPENEEQQYMGGLICQECAYDLANDLGE